MAGEVIDLISSSPPAEPRPKSKTKTASATRSTPYAPVDLEGLTDEFDTTGDLDGQSLLSQRSTNIRGSALRAAAVPGVEILSDDFQSTGDLAEPILVESVGNGNKRRRISPSPNLLSSPRKTSRQITATRVDEFSDPFASSPPPPTADIVKSRGASLQGSRTSTSGLTSLETSHTREDSSDAFTTSLAAPGAQTTEKTTKFPSSRQQEESDREDAPRRQSSREKSAREEDVGFPRAHGMPGAPNPEQVAKSRARWRPSKSRPFSPVAREASTDPFASSPAPKAPSPAHDPVDLTQQVEEHAPRRKTSNGKTTSQQRASRHQSPDPFASSPQNTTTFHSKKTDFEISSPPPVKKVTSQARRQQWDPISSSAPEANVINIDSDSSSDNDSDDFPDIDSVVKNASQISRSQLSRSRSDVLPRAKMTNKVSNAKQPARTADERARDKARREADKEREKQRKKEERERTKEGKAREKERATALVEANKMKTDKKVSTPEMIVDVPSSLDDGTRVQLDTLLETLGVELSTWDTSDAVVKWRRKVTCKWNEDLGYWEPIPKRIMHEKHVAVIMTAQAFVDLALDHNGGIRSHIMSMEEKFAGNQIIYVLEGMTPWMRKNRNLRNRQFTSGVRSETTGGARRRAPAQEYISEDLIEDALLELQVMHDVLIHHTTIPLETAQWITVLTQHISTIPYKQQKSQAQGAGFCMESGQVKTGEDNKDTYVRLLQEIARVTQPIAYGVTIEFPSVTELVNRLSDGGPMRLSDVRKTVNREGTLGEKKIGQAVSKRIHQVFTGRDEASTDV